MNRSRRQLRGFTLLGKIEPRGHGMHWILGAILAMSFLGLVTGMIAVSVAPSFACCSMASTARRNIATVVDLVKRYRAQHGHLPPSLDALVTSGMTDRAPCDPWGNAFAYSIDGDLPVVTSRGSGERPDISSNDL